MGNSMNIRSMNKEIDMRKEIIELKEELASFNITFKDLVSYSPNNTYTKEVLLDLAYALAKDDVITSSINDNKLLNVKLISLRYGTKKRVIKKWKIYITALILILQRDKYIYIKSFLRSLEEDYDE